MASTIAKKCGTASLAPLPFFCFGAQSLILELSVLVMIVSILVAELKTFVEQKERKGST